MNNIQKQARAALFSLKEIVLEVLYEARDEGYIQPHEIRKRLGLDRAKEPGVAANTLIFGILYYLDKDGYVEAETGQGWRITQAAASLFAAAEPDA